MCGCRVTSRQGRQWVEGGFTVTLSITQSRRFALLIAAALMAATVLISGNLAGTANVGVHPNLKALKTGFASAPTTADCLATFGVRCYRPAQIYRAYDINRLRADGIDGRGQTILIVDAFGSPTLAADLKVFDKTFGLPQIIERGGAVEHRASSLTIHPSRVAERAHAASRSLQEAAGRYRAGTPESWRTCPPSRDQRETQGPLCQEALSSTRGD